MLITQMINNLLELKEKFGDIPVFHKELNFLDQQPKVYAIGAQELYYHIGCPWFPEGIYI